MKKKTQTFSESIAADVLGVQVETISKVVDVGYMSTSGSGPIPPPVATSELRGIDIAAILALVEKIGEIIMSLIGNCPQRQATRAAIGKPTFFVRLGVRNRVSQKCAECSDPTVKGLAGKIADALLSRAPQAVEADVFAVIDECQATPDNWI